jgi:hypothetical protein
MGDLMCVKILENELKITDIWPFLAELEYELPEVLLKGKQLKFNQQLLIIFSVI